MVKIFVASFNRASDGAISKLVKKLKKESMYTNYYEEADYILAVGDRKETHDFVLERFRENKKIIHLWAGEISKFETHDDVYRHSMTLMSCLQLCTNNEAFNRVRKLCLAVGKEFNAEVVGNVMLDNLDEIDESLVPNHTYDLVLYNPPTTGTEIDVINEIGNIHRIRENFAREFGCYPYIWLDSNGDMYSELIDKYVTHRNIPRHQFLGLLKNCNRFITNSSCSYYEAPFIMKNKNNIIHIGVRNAERESKTSNMSIPNASENIMQILRKL